MSANVATTLCSARCFTAGHLLRAGALDGYPPSSVGKRCPSALPGTASSTPVGPPTLVAIDAAAAAEGAPNLAEIVSLLEAAGYRGQMAARPGGRLMCFTCHTESDVSDVSVEALRRAEGASDPDDMLAVVALTCPRCDSRATVVLGYGPEATEDDSEVLRRLAPPRPA